LPIGLSNSEAMDLQNFFKITPEQAVEILKKHGTVISVEEAKLVLDFLYDLVKLALDEDFKL